MKQTFLLLIIAISCSSLFGQSEKFNYQEDFPKLLKASKDENSEFYYEDLLQQFQTLDTNLTSFKVLALLIGFTDSSNFRPYSYTSTERKIYKLNDEGKYQEALELSNRFLAKVPVSQKGLIEKSYALYKLEKDSAQYFSAQYQMIMNAMASSGDGLNPETAVFALGPTDGQNFITKYLNSGIGIMGSGEDKYGNFVDILELIWKDQETGEESRINLYFQIEHATKTMFKD